MIAPLGTIEQAGHRSWAYVQLPGGWFLNNTGIVVGTDGEDTILVDTCATDRRTRHLLAKAREIAGAPSACVSTHHHGDHTYGHHLLPEDTPIWAAPAARDEAAETGLRRYEEMLEQPEWGEQELRLATDLVPASGARLGPLQAFPYPGVAHTRGDVVAWVPEDGVLYTGDLVFSGVAPLALSGSVTGWIEALDWLRGFDPDVLVPGHGPISHHPMSALDDMEQYLSLIRDAAEEAVDDKSDAATAAANLDLGHFADWEDTAERTVINVHRAIADLTGEPFDLGTAVAHALDAAGGIFPCYA